MMNGLGGSGDFTRAAYLSIFTTPSTAKDGKISAFVPMASHLDHSEHSVKIIVSEYGVADMRGKSPVQRAREIIDKCAHPDYRSLLNDYLNMGIQGHTPQNLKACFAFHRELAASGDMHNVDWNVYNR
jgi:acyl-CoA hydrolase